MVDSLTPIMSSERACSTRLENKVGMPALPALRPPESGNRPDTIDVSQMETSWLSHTKCGRLCFAGQHWTQEEGQLDKQQGDITHDS